MDGKLSNRIVYRASYRKAVKAMTARRSRRIGKRLLDASPARATKGYA